MKTNCTVTCISKKARPVVAFIEVNIDMLWKETSHKGMMYHQLYWVHRNILHPVALPDWGAPGMECYVLDEVVSDLTVHKSGLISD